MATIRVSSSAICSAISRHRRPLDGFADCLGIGRVVLVALDVGLNILRRHEANLMAKRPQLARPVMRRRTGLHADQTRPQAGKEPEHLTAPKPSTHHHAVNLIDAVDLKDVLGQIQPNRCNHTHGWLPLMVTFDDHHSGTQMPSGGHPPHQFEFPLTSHCGRVAASVVMTRSDRISVIPLPKLNDRSPPPADSNRHTTSPRLTWTKCIESAMRSRSDRLHEGIRSAFPTVPVPHPCRCASGSAQTRIARASSGSRQQC